MLTTACKHPAVLVAAQAQVREGHALVLLAVDGRGRVDRAAMGSIPRRKA